MKKVLSFVKSLLPIAYIVGYLYLYIRLSSFGLEWWLVLITFVGFVLWFYIQSRKGSIDFYKITYRFTLMYGLFVVTKLFYMPFWVYGIGVLLIILGFMGLLTKKFILNPVKAYRYLLCKFDLWLMEVQVTGASQVIKDKEQLDKYLVDKKILYYIEIYKKRIEVFENDGYKYSPVK